VNEIPFINMFDALFRLLSRDRLRGFFFPVTITSDAQLVINLALMVTEQVTFLGSYLQSKLIIKWYKYSVGQ
jgi:hypothetical protein